MMHHMHVDPGRPDIFAGPAASWPVPAIHVRERMSQPPVTIEDGAYVAAAAALMRSRQIRHLPVIDMRGHLVGMLSDRDLPSVAGPGAAGRADDARLRVTVALVMTRPPVTIEPDADLRTAASLMQERRIGALPVLDGDRLVGIVTECDVLRAFTEALRRQ
jgi:acetoin utilization protein AcuB